MLKPLYTKKRPFTNQIQKAFIEVEAQK